MVEVVASLTDLGVLNSAILLLTRITLSKTRRNCTILESVGKI
jgi:hypothetical protein